MKVHILATALALATPVACATPQAAAPAPAPAAASVSTGVTKTSNADFVTTDKRLAAALEKRGLTLFTTVDHSAGAKKVDLNLAPSKVYIFGNPRAGTPLMLANPALGLDLPLKALVYEDKGTVKVTVSDIRAITARAGVTEPAQLITNVENALAGILTEATDG